MELMSAMVAVVAVVVGIRMIKTSRKHSLTVHIYKYYCLDVIYIVQRDYKCLSLNLKGCAHFR